MLIGEVLERVQSAYSKGAASKDTRLASRYIYNATRTARSKLLRQRYNKNQYISAWSYQELTCVDLQTVKVNPLLTKATTLRSVQKIPSIISSLDAPIIKSISSLDGNTTFDSTSFTGAKYGTGNKYTANKADYYIKDGYLHLTGVKHLAAMTIVALFNDPIEADLFALESSCPPCDDCLCKAATEYDFHLDEDLTDAVIGIASQELIVLFSQMKEDKTNSSSDDNNAQVNYRTSQSQNNDER